ncbi:MAG: dTMP kinase [Sphingomonadaceae bacterium]
MSARFITLEGGEGVGKSTQLKALADAIRAQGHSVVTTREPGGSPGAEAIRSLLMTGDKDRWSSRAEALLFAAARADHVEKTIRPALERGDWVLCDRFVDSTRAYQGGAGGLSDTEILSLHTIGCGGLMPDRTFLLTLDLDQAAARAETRDGGKADRFALQTEQYHRSVAKAFLDMAAASPDRIHLVSAVGSPEAVTARLMAGLSDLL